MRVERCLSPERRAGGRKGRGSGGWATVAIAAAAALLAGCEHMYGAGDFGRLAPPAVAER